MGRRPRIHYPGAVYHVMARGVDGRAIFIDEHDRHEFLRSLEHLKQQTNATVYAYCLMGNHFHLAIKVESVPLALFMQRLLTGYSRTFNGRHARTGHLFQARYKAVLCTDDQYLIALIRYIHTNPVRAGLTILPGDWPWSSYREYRARGNDDLLPSESDFPDFDPWKVDNTAIPGALLRSNVEMDMTIDEMGQSVSSHTGISVAELRSGSKCHRVVQAKRLLTRTAVAHGQHLSAVANWLGTTRGTVTHYLREKQSKELSA